MEFLAIALLLSKKTSVLSVELCGQLEDCHTYTVLLLTPSGFRRIKIDEYSTEKSVNH